VRHGAPANYRVDVAASGPTVEEPIWEQWTLVQAAVLQLLEPG